MEKIDLITEDQAPKYVDDYGRSCKLEAGDRFKIIIDGVRREFLVVSNDHFVSKMRDKMFERDNKQPKKSAKQFTAFGRSKVNIYG